MTAPEAIALPRSSARRRGSLGPFAIAWLLLAVVVVLATMLGTTSIPASAVLGAIWNHLPLIGGGVSVEQGWERIVIDVRLPRVVTAGLAGAALASSGAAYQGVFRNPLADPFLLGVASGAALGAALGVVLPIPALGYSAVPVLAFVGAVIAVVLAYTASRTGATVSNTSLILAGVAIAAMAGAATSFILLTSNERALTIFGFLFGSFNAASWPRALTALPYLVVGITVLLVYARVLNVLQLDEEQADQLGVDVSRTRMAVLTAASLTAATAVAMAGVIGFVGLIVPHVVRIVFGVDYRRVLPLSALLGAVFLIAADMLARTVLRPQEVPVGIVTAMVGGPFFLALMRSRLGALR
ncbi:MAG: iron ABC transporter permease [Chloroflexi bacterium]|nr:MAG: iron ABC transporter permease [Chloroflexota bacterium]